MKTLVFIVGTRPDLIKTAPLILECARRKLSMRVLHGGQHYDVKMDQIFRENFDMPTPDVRLLEQHEIQGKSPGWQFVTTVERMSRWIDAEKNLGGIKKPVVVVYGDTWSALACTSASVRLGVPVVHLEAGLRSYDLTMPEEVARIQMDTVSTWLFPPTEAQRHTLQKEGFTAETHVCGNLIADAMKMVMPIERPEYTPDHFAVMTLHRPENVGDVNRFRAVLKFVEKLSEELRLKIVWPVHPRVMNSPYCKEVLEKKPECLSLIEPVGYPEMLSLMEHCELVITDSGGMQEEACILGKKCVTLRKNTERPETVALGSNVLVDVMPPEGGKPKEWGKYNDKWVHPYGEDVAVKMTDIFEKRILGT